MTCCALSDVALPEKFSGASSVGSRGQQPVSRSDFFVQVQAWSHYLASMEGERVALYEEDTLAFAAALWGAWHAGKHVVLPGDTLPRTLEQLLPQVQACIGSLPHALPRPPFPIAGIEPLQPLSLTETKLSMFTSGSSGQPERIDKTLRQLDAEVQALEGLFGGDVPSACDTVVLATVSHQHIYGLLFRVLWPLATGRQMQSHLLRYPEQVLEQLRLQTQCVLVSSPAMLGRLPTHLDWPGSRKSLYAVFSSGGPLPEEASHLAQSLLGQSPTEIFGSSETGGIAWRRRAQHGAQWNLLPHVRCRVDAQQLLQVASPHLPDPNRWFTTADRVALTPCESSFQLMGRADRIVKIAEKRVSLTVIEQALCTSPWVRIARAVVLPLHSNAAAQRVGVALELTEQGWQQLQAVGRKAFGSDLQGVVAPHVERVALPRHWRYVERLPMNAQGKCTQHDLAQLFRPVFPQVQWLERGAHHARAQWNVAADLLVFDGHFPQSPLVPGVSQVHWVEWTARQALHLPPNFVRAEVLKFQIPILPGAQVQVDLQWVAEKSALQFVLTSPQGTHASGRLIWKI